MRLRSGSRSERARVRANALGVCAAAIAGAVVVVAVTAGSAAAVRRTAASGTVLFSDSFSVPNGLITNEYAYWNPNDPAAVKSKNWEMTSGSLFARSSAGWTGVPDNIDPNAGSTNGTDSAVFRLNTRNYSFGNVAVSFSLDNLGYTQTSTTPAVDWDGVHIFLRYQNEYSLYYASINRRDNTAVIKKKVPGGPYNGGTYYILASTTHSYPFDAWQSVKATVANNGNGSVTIKLYAQGSLVLQATDTGTGGAPITHAGAVGIRGDNDNFQFDDFRVTSL